MAVLIPAETQLYKFQFVFYEEHSTSLGNNKLAKNIREEML